MQNIACRSCSSAMFVKNFSWCGDQAGFLCVVSFCVARRAQAQACLSTKTPCDRCFSDLGHAWTGGGGGMKRREGGYGSSMRAGRKLFRGTPAAVCAGVGGRDARMSLGCL